MQRKFIKRARPFGEEQMPPGPGMLQSTPPGPPASGSAPPGGGGMPGAQNSAPGAATSPSKPPMAPGGSPTPPKPPQGPQQAPTGPPQDSGLKPRTPGGESGLGGGSGTPTDVEIDAATGKITVKKGPVNFVIASPYEGQRGWSEPEEMPGGYDNPIDPSTGQGSFETPVYSYGPGEEQAPVETIPTQEQAPEELPPQGRFSPRESVKTRDPDTGIEQYGFIVKMTDDGMYMVSYEDGSKKELHEGWIIPAPEAANADAPANNSPQGFAALARKSATHQDFIDFKANDNEPQYGDWADEKTYSKDTHDSPFAHPKNRLEAPKFTIRGTVPEYLNGRAIAYALEVQMSGVDVDLEGDTLIVRGVSEPLSMITELNEYGIDASTDENLTKYPQGFKDLYKLGQKVALVGDYPDMNYYYDPTRPAAQAMITGKQDGQYIVTNDMWGSFKAREDELNGL